MLAGGGAFGQGAGGNIGCGADPGAFHEFCCVLLHWPGCGIPGTVWGILGTGAGMFGTGIAIFCVGGTGVGHCPAGGVIVLFSEDGICKLPLFCLMVFG